MMDTKVINLNKLILVLVSLPFLYMTSLYNYLLFHSLAELFSIFTACGIFIVAWHSRAFLENNYLLFLGVAYLFIGTIDLLHTLAYKGMGVFLGYDANLPTQLWIAVRYMESLSLLVAVVFLKKKLNAERLMGIYAMFTGLLLFSIFYPGWFPDCFTETTGLTAFKKISEYIISLFLVIAIAFIIKSRTEFDPAVFILLTTSLFLTIGAELMFTFYISVYGLSNLIGHYLKLVSFYLIYIAVVQTGLEKPYSLMFRKLKKSEAELRRQRNDLQKALNEIKTLKGILPICASCKKIRDDRGFWKVVEAYIQEHSDAEFSHSICPDCAKKLYPELDIYESDPSPK
ncbi:MAG: MASE3 domain-containing protein [Desulfobacterales bacterium]|nr:MASE3 domain-containing protein [Desulfobacterales bacterium]